MKTESELLLFPLPPSPSPSFLDRMEERFYEASKAGNVSQVKEILKKNPHSMSTGGTGIPGPASTMPVRKAMTPLSPSSWATLALTSIKRTTMGALPS